MRLIDTIAGLTKTRHSLILVRFAKAVSKSLQRPFVLNRGQGAFFDLAVIAKQGELFTSVEPKQKSLTDNANYQSGRLVHKRERNVP